MKRVNENRKMAKDVLISNSDFGRNCLIRLILKEKLLEHKCALCPLINFWNDKPLILQLDHINGINNDHRLENLRFLCPNCHSQTENFSGKNIKKKEKRLRSSPLRKVNYALVFERYNILKNYSKVAEEFNVSDTTIRKIIKNWDIG